MKKLAAIWQARATCFWREWLLFAVAVYLVYPLFAEGYFVGHETLAPLERVYGIDLAVASGQFPPKVLPNLVNGLGYGWNIFYSPLAYDFTWLISALGFSYTTSLKLVHFLAILFSGAFLYLLVMRLTRHNTAALIAAVLYMAAPYRLVDLYVRNAYAESFAFVFLPVVFLGVYEIFHGDPHRWWILAAGMSGIVLTHNISGMYCALFVMAYVITQARRLLKEVVLLRSLGLAALMSTLLMAYFVGPLLEHKATNNYAIFNADMVSDLYISAENIHDHAIKFWQLFSHNFDLGGSLPLASDRPEMPFLVGIPLMLFAALGAYAMRRHPARSLIWFSVAAALLSLVMTLDVFPWEFMPGFLYYLQFPWRLFLFTVFFLSLAGGSAALLLPGHYHRALFIVLVVALLCLYVFNFIQPDYQAAISDASIPAVEDVRVPDSMIGTGFAEYLPTQSFNRRSYLRAHGIAPVVLSGAATLQQLSRFGTNLTLSAEINGTEALIELPFVHYLGYKATLRTKDGVTQALTVFEGPNGLSSVVLRDSGVVVMWYGVTSWSALAYAMTLAGLLWLVLIVVRNLCLRSVIQQ